MEDEDIIDLQSGKVLKGMKKEFDMNKLFPQSPLMILKLVQHLKKLKKFLKMK